MSDTAKRRLKKAVPFAIAAVLLVVSAYFGHLAYKEYGVYDDAEKTNKSVQDMAQGDEYPQELDENGRPHVDESLLPDHELIDDADENEYDIDAPYDLDKPSLDWYMSMQLHVADLQEINSDVLCWVYIPNTSVNYPVMQEKWDAEHNNSRGDYLYEDINNDYSIEGSLFVKAFPPTLPAERNGHMTIFGHNMKNGSMFSTLTKYKKKDFFDQNPYVYLFYPDRTERWVVWTSSYITTSDDNPAPVYNTYLELGSDEYKNCIDSLYESRYYDTWVKNVGKNTRTLTLSTCDWSSGNHSGRLVVTAVKSKTLIWKGSGENNGTSE